MRQQIDNCFVYSVLHFSFGFSIYSLYKRQQDYLNAWKNAQQQPYYGAAPNYAYATGAIGPSGIHQSAGVQPPNKVGFVSWKIY